ncbi:MAG: YdiU family protein [Burkholderiales bacterium]|nr:YdiU family protein [Nitrosomonas sp.]MCP5274507.1 YdiU family protein [Burkholderiales bacterium]
MKTVTKTINNSVGWRFDNSYARLPESFFARIRPVPVCAPSVVILNHALAESLGLDLRVLSKTEAALLFSGNILPETTQPIAQAYAGHQFGSFTMLGDGRAILIGEHVTATGERFDIQFKGSGRTPFSRQGDGRAALAPMLREYIISEAIHALGIPTTRSLAVVTTGETVMREMPLPGAILTRVAASHIRVGTFEYVIRKAGAEGVRTLADYTIHRHYPELAESRNPYLALLDCVIARQASLVTQWLLVGFIHGVMNTDNMAISGETIDFGPCAFMDEFDPQTVFSSIDYHGRYSYSNQSHVAQWNLARFAETLLPLLHPEQEKALALAEESIRAFPDVFQNHWLAGMRKKLGLFTEDTGDVQLIETLLTLMHKHRADYTNSFRALASVNLPKNDLFNDPAFEAWRVQWQARLSHQSETMQMSFELMRENNPAILPRNHRVEEALTAASEGGDYTLLNRLLAAVAEPYVDAPEYDDYHVPPLPSERVQQTFCGT